MKQNWYFTFEEWQVHPTAAFSLKGYHVVIKHKDKLRARAEMIARFGNEGEGWNKMMDEMEFRRYCYGVQGKGPSTALTIINILD